MRDLTPMKRFQLLAFSLAVAFFGLNNLLHSEFQTNTATRVKAALSSGQPALIEFGAETCSQCKRMKEVLDSISQRYRGRAQVVQVNVNKDKAITRQFKIMVIPTLVFFDATGKEVGRTYGFMDEVKVARKLHDLGAR
jgi:thioredoxin 1